MNKLISLLLALALVFALAACGSESAQVPATQPPVETEPETEETQAQATVVCVMGSDSMYSDTAAAIEAAGWTEIETFRNPAM